MGGSNFSTLAGALVSGDVIVSSGPAGSLPLTSELVEARFWVIVVQVLHRAVLTFLEKEPRLLVELLRRVMRSGLVGAFIICLLCTKNYIFLDVAPFI